MSYEELAAQVARLRASLVERDATLVERDAILVERDRLIAQLSARVAQLEARVSKNSQNSSKPPSSDAFVKPPPRSLRRASGRKPGKQPGGQGFALEPRPEPDEVVVHVPGACRSCGGDLSSAPVVGEQVRQVFDLPPIELVAVEHRAQQRACGCGALTTASFPPEATAPACYGPGVAALGAYLLGRQHLPVERAAEAMADCFGARSPPAGWPRYYLPRPSGSTASWSPLVHSWPAPMSRTSTRPAGGSPRNCGGSTSPAPTR